MKKSISELTPDEYSLRYGNEPIQPLIERMGIKTPTNNDELENFNMLMEQIFGLSANQDKCVPIRYLLVCEAIEIKSVTLIGFKALLPERPWNLYGKQVHLADRASS